MVLNTSVGIWIANVSCATPVSIGTELMDLF
jgi:hypothetical protein